MQLIIVAFVAAQLIAGLLALVAMTRTPGLPGRQGQLTS